MPIDFGGMWERICSVAWLRTQDLKSGWQVTRKRLHRYSGVISFFGAAIIPVMYIVTEKTKEAEKEAVAALESVQKSYESRVATDKISDQIKDLSEKIKPQPDVKWKDELIESYKGASVRFARMKLLAGTEDRELKRIIDLQDKTLQKLLNDLQPAGPVSPAFRNAAQMELDEASSILNEMEEGLIQGLEQKVKKARKRLQRFDSWSPYVYVLGAFTAVLGQLAGVKAAGGE